MNQPEVELGAYGKKQLQESGGVISWSHRRRFAQAGKYLEKYAPKMVLDYGCGDGTFLLTNRSLLSAAIGVDPDASQIDSCRRRNLSNTLFEVLNPSFVEKYKAQFDLIFCQEVLEHCLPEQRREVLENLRKLVSPQGTIVISVPNEIGMSLLAKEFFRTLAALRKVGQYEYKEKYTFGELGKMSFAGAKSTIDRPVYFHDSILKVWPYHGHKGFNWKNLSLELDQYFKLEEVAFSPIPSLRSILNSQIWFVLKPV